MRHALTYFITLLAFSVASPPPAAADEEVSPHVYVVASKGGRFYLKMELTGKTYYKRPYAGRATVYQVVNGGADKAVWSTSGWWAFQTHLSYDGRYVVRIGDWPRGHQPSNKHLAIAFYDRGKLLANYSTKKLIKDPSKVNPSVSHYEFSSSVEGFDGWSYAFTLTTIDGLRYRFDARTGKVISVK